MCMYLCIEYIQNITCRYLHWYLRIWLQIAYTMSMKMGRYEYSFGIEMSIALHADSTLKEYLFLTKLELLCLLSSISMYKNSLQPILDTN